VRRDEERIEEEIGGAERPARPRNLSAAYLDQAIDALQATGNAPSLYRPWPPLKVREDNAIQRGVVGLDARRARRMFCRSAVLFAALAAESYVNEFLAVHLADRPDDLRKIDRWPTVKKYVRGTGDAYGEQLFFDDREAMPVIRELFELRHKLVHPKPGFGPPHLFESDAESEIDFAPPKIAEFVVMVAGAGDLLVRRAYGFDALDVTAAVAWMGRSVIRVYGQRAAAMPPPSRPPERPLFLQALEHVQKLPSLPNDPTLSANRLAAARPAS
jgi:hypothetical protein